MSAPDIGCDLIAVDHNFTTGVTVLYLQEGQRADVHRAVRWVRGMFPETHSIITKNGPDNDTATMQYRWSETPLPTAQEIPGHGHWQVFDFTVVKMGVLPAPENVQ